MLGEEGGGGVTQYGVNADESVKQRLELVLMTVGFKFKHIDLWVSEHPLGGSMMSYKEFLLQKAIIDNKYLQGTVFPNCKVN